MKLFSRGGNDAAKPTAPAGPAAANATAPPLPAPTAPAAAPQSVVPTAPPAEAPAGPPEPDLTSILDANVKEMSEKIARLSSSLESTSTEKQQFEQKLEQMEDRMRKLSALTEMISAQYNPFVGDAPSEREPLPTPEIGLSSPPTAAPPQAAAAAPNLAPLSLEPPMMAPEPEPMEDPLASFGELPPLPAYDEAPAAPAYAPEYEEEESSPAHVWTIRPSFESSLLMLGWADMLLKNVPSRDSLAELVSYYHNIGWLGDPARDQLLAYADGIAVAARQDAPSDWRANVDVHEKSLLFLEKLKALSARRTR